MNRPVEVDRALRKLQLLKEGENFRTEIQTSREIVQTQLHKKLLSRITDFASSALRNRAQYKSSNLATMLPVVVTGVSWLSHRYNRKFILIGTAIIATLASAAFVSSRNSNPRRENE